MPGLLDWTHPLALWALGISVQHTATIHSVLSGKRAASPTILHSKHLELTLHSVMALYHKEFEKAGKTTGLQIWRIEKMELVQVPESLFGSFYVGDAYLVLRTVKEKNSCFFDLHYWLGKLFSIKHLSVIVYLFTMCIEISLTLILKCIKCTFCFKIAFSFSNNGTVCF